MARVGARGKALLSELHLAQGLARLYTGTSIFISAELLPLEKRSTLLR